MAKNTAFLKTAQETHHRFSEIVEQALSLARQKGATDAVADIAEGLGLSVSVRKATLETVEQTNDRSLSVTVYVGQRRGSASTSDFSVKAIEQTVEAAMHIARYTAEDAAAGLPESSELATHFPELALHTPWDVDATDLTQIAIRAEKAALELDPHITNSDGAAASRFEGQFVMGNTRGFLAGYPYSRHGFSVSPIASLGTAMQRDYWSSSARDPRRLAQPEAVGRYAAQRALSRLSARQIRTGQFPVLFDAPLALGLLGAVTQALSGGALYRKASFLVDSLGKSIFPDHIHIDEDPYIPGALGSSAFDDEGVQTRARSVVTAGVVQGYFLSVYSARKLGMTTTANAGGSHNLVLRSNHTNPGDDLNAMLKKLGTGFFVTELIGQGVNYLTGDYSRGAFGYWVKNGQIQHAVEEVTIAGNLNDMFKQIVAVGADTITRGSKTTGSILLENMAIAGL